MPIKREYNRNFFGRWSPEMAYVLGFVFADGAVWRGKRGNWFVAFYSTDKEIIEKIKSSFRSTHKIGVRNKQKPWKKLYVLQIGSKNLCEQLAAFGVIQNKSNVIKFPNIPPEHLGNFVRGYFDGDGCVHLGTYWRKDRKKWKTQLSVNFTSGSKKFLEGLFHSLRGCVEGGWMGRKTRGHELVFGRNDAVALFSLMYNNVPAGLFLERKKRVFLKAFRKLKIAAVV